MAKLLLVILALLILVLIIIAMYCVLVIAGRSDDGNGGNNGENECMCWKRPICPSCKIGKESYELDRHSDACPYIGSWKNGKCQFYVPVEKASKIRLLSALKNKRSVSLKK